MTSFEKWLIVAFAIGIAMLTLATAVVAQQKPHLGPDHWYDFECCSEKDCRQTVLNEVERRDDGWFVVPTNELIPFNDKRIRRSRDPLLHLCCGKELNGICVKVRCLYVPDPGI
jgi:hypothetical protein